VRRRPIQTLRTLDKSRGQRQIRFQTFWHLGAKAIIINCLSEKGFSKPLGEQESIILKKSPLKIFRNLHIERIPPG
jgi:hypothetical protein